MPISGAGSQHSFGIATSGACYGPQGAHARCMAGRNTNRAACRAFTHARTTCLLCEVARTTALRSVLATCSPWPRVVTSILVSRHGCG